MEQVMTGLAGLGAAPAPGEADPRRGPHGDLASEAVRFWQVLDLQEQKGKMDKFEIEIEENHSKSVAARKRLAQETKSFRQLNEPDERAKRFGPLLRAYQEEIDRLTKRARYSDGAFRDLYKSLYEAPDPAPIMMELVERNGKVTQLEIENERLRRELDENEEEFALLQNQDVAIRKLEAELEEARRATNQKAHEAASAKERELLAELEARISEFEGKESEAKAEINDLRSCLAEERAALQRAQEELFDCRAANEESEAQLQSEIDYLTDDLQRATAQASSLEAECERLNAELAGRGASRGGTAADQLHRAGEVHEQDRTRVLELEDELIRKHETEEQLRQELMRYQSELDAQLERHGERVHELEAVIKAMNEQSFALKVQLAARPTQESFDKVKAQLRMLQAIDLGAELPSGVGPEGGALDDALDEGGFDSKLLIHGRIRKLEATATNLRVQLEACQQELVAARHEKFNAEERLKDQEALVRRLEVGNAVINAHSNQTFGSSNQVGEERLRHPATAASAADLLLAATGDLTARTLRQTSGFGDLAAAEGGPGTGQNASGESLLGIVHEQRNVFRKRMIELEEERDALARRLQEAEQHVSTLQSDNVTLFEKIKYLQTYTTHAQIQRPPRDSEQESSASASGSRAPERIGAVANYGQGRGTRLNANQQSELRISVQGRSAGASGQVETKYRTMYEDKINPFNDFSARERKRRYAKLNAAEKITLNATSFFLSNKYTRSFVFFYALTLHLLVFLALFANTHSGCEYPQQRQHDPHQFSPQHAVLHESGGLLEDSTAI